MLKFNIFKRFASYLWPLRLWQGQSAVSGRVEVWLINGRAVVETENANYSFGSLHKVFRTAFRQGKFRENAQGPVLLLGLGGGSVPVIVRRELGMDLPITAVDADPLMLQLSVGLMGDAGRGVERVQADAYAYMEANKKVYGTIIIDLFVDNKVPEQFCTPAFLRHMVAALKPGGYLYMNFIREENGAAQALAVGHWLGANGGGLQVINAEETNCVLVWKCP